MSIDVDLLLSFFLRVQISLPDRRMGKASVLSTFILEKFWTKLGLKAKAKFNPEQSITKHAKWNVRRKASKRRGTLHSVRFINNNGFDVHRAGLRNVFL